MALETGGIGHIALRVADLDRAKRFYTEVLGFPAVVETDGLVLVNVHGTLIGLRGGAPETAPSDRFDPFRVGLDHLALTVPETGALDGLGAQLDAARIPNNGVEHDELTGGDYIAFYDPDGIAWELYAMPSR